jgi:hypothetical protein
VFRSPRTQRRTREAPPALPPMRGIGPEAPGLPAAPIARGTLDPGANRPVPAKKAEAEKTAPADAPKEGEGGGHHKAEPELHAEGAAAAATEGAPWTRR